MASRMLEFVYFTHIIDFEILTYYNYICYLIILRVLFEMRCNYNI